MTHHEDPGALPEHVRRIVDEIETDSGDDAPEAGAPAAPNGGIEAAVRQILLEIGEEPDREGLRDTPARMHRMYHELTAGYHVDPDRLINHALFEVPYSEMVVVKDIPFYSLCEHHLLPFFGVAHVAYVPNGRVAPRGVGVVLEATHLCAAMRGVRKPGTVMTTAAVLGLFRRNDKTRAEFFAHIGRPSPEA